MDVADFIDIGAWAFVATFVPDRFYWFGCLFGCFGNFPRFSPRTSYIDLVVLEIVSNFVPGPDLLFGAPGNCPGLHHGLLRCVKVSMHWGWGGNGRARVVGGVASLCCIDVALAEG